jgi:hypothetical protein
MYCTYRWFLRVLGHVSSMLRTTGGEKGRGGARVCVWWRETSLFEKYDETFGIQGASEGGPKKRAQEAARAARRNKRGPPSPEWSTPESMGLQLSCSAPPQHMTASGWGALVFQVSLVELPGWMRRGAPLLLAWAWAATAVGWVGLVIHTCTQQLRQSTAAAFHTGRSAEGCFRVRPSIHPAAARAAASISCPRVRARTPAVASTAAAIRVRRTYDGFE